MPIPPKEFYLPFLRQEQQALDTISFFFSSKGRPAFGWDFVAGQYIRMFLDLPQEDPRGNYRSFSICSSPEQRDILMITTKVTATPSIFKQKLSSLNPGEKIRFFGPLGVFVLPEQSERPLVFLAGGIGITPLHSMLLHAKAINYKTPITLFVSCSTVEEAAFYDELTNISQEHQSIKVIYTITHPEESQTPWIGETGRISPELIKKYVPQEANAQYFICGPQKMVDAMVEMVQEMNVPPEQIKKENFTGY